MFCSLQVSVNSFVPTLYFRLYPLDTTKSIADKLSGKDIVKYPSFVVSLKAHWPEYSLGKIVTRLN